MLGILVIGIVDAGVGEVYDDCALRALAVFCACRAALEGSVPG